MRIERTATIIVTLDPLGVEERKYFTGTEEEIYAEAHDFMNEVVMRFIDSEAVEDPEEQYLVADCASHTIVWDEWDGFVKLFAVYEDNADEPVLGVFATLADAEEAIFTECESWVYETMMRDDPNDMLGWPEWNWHYDWKYLMWDASRCFHIQEVPGYDVRGVFR